MKQIFTYSQYNEDLILAALLYDIEKGFYVDVGANLPEQDSVTKYFYNKDWSGINIEPIPRLYEQLKKARPRDININCGIGAASGKLIFREYTGDLHGHSTFSIAQKEEHDKSADYIDYEVEVKSLASILKENNVSNIHFLKIDVEGYEQEVLKGNDWSKYRPAIICIESDHKDNDWTDIITKQGYFKFIFDGLNEYYVRVDEKHRIKGFSERVTTLKHNAFPISKKHIIDDLESLREFTKKQDTQIKHMHQQVIQLQSELDKHNSIKYLLAKITELLKAKFYKTFRRK